MSISFGIPWKVPRYSLLNVDCYQLLLIATRLSEISFPCCIRRTYVCKSNQLGIHRTLYSEQACPACTAAKGKKGKGKKRGPKAGPTEADTIQDFAEWRELMKTDGWMDDGDEIIMTVGVDGEEVIWGADDLSGDVLQEVRPPLQAIGSNLKTRVPLTVMNVLSLYSPLVSSV